MAPASIVLIIFRIWASEYACDMFIKCPCNKTTLFVQSYSQVLIVILHFFIFTQQCFANIFSPCYLNRQVSWFKENLQILARIRYSAMLNMFLLLELKLFPLVRSLYSCILITVSKPQGQCLMYFFSLGICIEFVQILERFAPWYAYRFYAH